MENEKNMGSFSAGIKEAYEGKVATEALTRAGHNKNLHGIVHEVLYKDTQSLNPVNVVKGTKAILAKSTTGVRDDVLLINAGKIVGRAQLKDTPLSIGKTVQQVASGKYQGTALMGTKETVQAFNSEVAKAASDGVKITQKIQSTGISSGDTVRIASKALGGNISGKAIATAAKSSGAVGAAISGGIEVLFAGKDLIDGKIDGMEFTGRVAKEAAGGGLSAAAGGAAANAATTVAAGILAGTTAPLWAPVAIGIGGAVVVGSIVKGIWDAIWD
jgi:hypothetical protein